MPAYLIADVDITDREGFAEYQRQVPATVAAYGGRHLARGGAVEVLEGNWTPKRCVILEFPDMARLKAWWDSPEYVPLRAIRERTATTTVVATEGL